MDITSDEPFITGADLLEMGWELGFAFDTVLNRALAFQNDGLFIDRKAALRVVGRWEQG